MFSSILSVVWSKQFLLSCFTKEWEDDLEEIVEHKLSIWKIILYSKTHQYFYCVLQISGGLFPLSLLALVTELYGELESGI